ncbi:MAG: hypothetical protein Q8O67_24030 [Deltaproteobacteria bacterium]|nr:hypothetical protein [Deltaproteobacteria bacterium]
MGSAAAIAGASSLVHARKARAQVPADRKFLFVISAAGGGSIVDSFLPTIDSESPNGSTLVTYPNTLIAEPNGSNLRCVHSPIPIDLGGFSIVGHLRPFLERHGSDVAVMTQECTSVNHLIAQKRSLTGAGINGGRTILEAAALQHGSGLLMPAVNMCESGYLEPGDDVSVPDSARAVAVADALLFPFATDGVRGLKNIPSRSLVERARGIRNRVDDDSTFGITFRNAPLRKGFIDARVRVAPTMEANDLITKLTMVANVPGAIPLDDFDLESSPDGERVRARFPDLLSDPFEAQGALAFLLARYGVSCAVALSPSFNPLLDGGLKNTPLAFDFSHTNHVLTQYAMWSRVLRVADGLITLLKEQDLDDADPSQGKMWDRSLVYIATDFGRDKTRPADSFEFGSGHHLNNGNILVSPLLNGNRVYGGVDVNTLLTFGFDPITGAPAPGTLMREGEVYSAVAHALGIDFDGRVDMPCMVKNA